MTKSVVVVIDKIGIPAIRGVFSSSRKATFFIDTYLDGEDHPGRFSMVHLDLDRTENGIEIL